MTSPDGLSGLIAGEERLYALQEPKGPLRAHWGKTRASGSESLTFRKFHFPRLKEPSAWGDFRDSTSWILTEERAFKHREISPAEFMAPPAAPFLSDRDHWNRLFEKALSSLSRGSAQKLVLARSISAEVTAGERAAMLKALPHLLFHPLIENAYVFLVKSRDSVFFGATPELLFQREGGQLVVPAVAGTLPLGGGVPESTLREQLLASKKDRDEHQWVVDGIRETLVKLGLQPSVPAQPSVLRTPRLLHLFTPITATDSEAIKGEQLMEALHPTPAIGGQPKTEAQGFLFEYESWDRGLYSAPLLVRSRGRELCLVGIRSGLLTRDTLHFFAGAGVVRGSTADGEWTETEHKLNVMKSILFGGRHG